MKSTLILLALSTTAAFSQSVLRPYTPPPQPVIVYTVTPSPFGKADGSVIRGSDGSSGTVRPSPFGAGFGQVITVTPPPSTPAIRPLW